MSKIVPLILLLLTIISITFVTNPAYALVSCPGPIADVRINRNGVWLDNPNNKPILIDTDRVAEFYININNNKNYPSYKIQFKCGINTLVTPFEEKDAKLWVDNASIYATLNKKSTRLGTPCEFDVGTHELIVKDPNGTELCNATYTVTNADDYCQLTIKDSEHPDTPEKDIAVTTLSKLIISGNNLSGRGFGLLFDDEILKGSHEADFINTTEFTDIIIDQNLLTLGQHNISLRAPILNKGGIIPLAQDALKGGASTLTRNYTWGLPLCPRVFIVGTPDEPGQIAAPGTNIPSGCTSYDITSGKCTSGAGQKIAKCNDPKDPDYDPAHPAVATAIGCIRTNPAELVQDFMKFIIGISGGLAFLLMLLGAFQMLTSAGNPETLHAGRERLTSAIIGLLIVIFAVLLLQIIGIDILGLPGFK